MKLICVHCGTYELAKEEEEIIRTHTLLQGIVCVRCNEEARLEQFAVLIVDQFADVPSPFALQQEPISFERLCVMCKGVIPAMGKRAELRIVDERFRPEMCTTVFRADKDGMAEVWMYRWDSSG